MAWVFRRRMGCESVESEPPPNQRLVYRDLVLTRMALPFLVELPRGFFLRRQRDAIKIQGRFISRVRLQKETGLEPE
jgi:hypothetical protein